MPQVTTYESFLKDASLESGAKNSNAILKAFLREPPVIICRKKLRLFNYQPQSCWLEHAAAGQSCVLSGCLVSIGGQSTRDRADHRAAGGQRAKGPELRRQILCRFHKCLFIVHVCLLAFIHVCGPVPVRWCHSVAIIDSCWSIFSALPVW